MLQLQRHTKIMELLHTRKEISVKELCAVLYLSPATVRRDLSLLEQQGLLKRSFGGASIIEAFSDQLPLSIRSARHIPEKKRICEAAAVEIEDGDTVFVDASSTTYFLSLYLQHCPHVTVITNNPHLSIALSERNIRNFCTGGEMLNGSIALVGSDTLLFISGILADKCFFSARGYDHARGIISDSSKAERDVKIAMLEHAKASYFLCDPSKRGLSFPYVITNASSVGKIIEGE